jgi:glycosyltransferase involved in cell wall biosynthesis
LKPVHIASYFTSPLKLFEYMASGKPIVASDLPAIREVLSHNTNSILVPPDNPEALAGGVRYILENPAMGEKIARQAAVDVLSYTWDERTKKIMDFIRSYDER